MLTKTTKGFEGSINLLSFTGGQFNLKRFAEPPTRSISGPWEFLVMEAASKTDEAKGSAALTATSPAAALAEAEMLITAGLDQQMPCRGWMGQ